MRRFVREWFKRREMVRRAEAEIVYDNAMLELQGLEPLSRRVREGASIVAEDANLAPAERRRLANALFTGSPGIPKDKDRAWALWRSAASDGDADSMYSVSMGVLSGGCEGTAEEATANLERVSTDSTASEETRIASVFALAGIAERNGDEDRALEWYTKNCEDGHGLSCFKAGELLRVRGEAVEARGRFEEGARRGDPECLHSLSIIYTNGDGMSSSDPKRGFECALKAAESDRAPPHAFFAVGNHYYHGVGVSRDPSKAIAWWTRAAESGFAYAQINLGTAYRDGVGVERKSLATARSWYEKAAPHSDVAKNLLRDLDKAFPHIARASQNP